MPWRFSALVTRFMVLFIIGGLLMLSSTPAALLNPTTVQAAQQSLWARDKAEGKLHIVMASGYPPFSFIGPDGKQTGFDTDLALEFAKRNGMSLDVKLISFSGVIPALVGKQTDMIVSIYATPERRKTVDFSETYWVAGISFISLKRKPKINSLEAAAGKTIAVYQGGFDQRFLSEHQPQAILKAYTGGMVAVFNDLDLGRVDAAFTDRDVASWYVREHPDRYSFSTELFAQGEYAWAIRKEDQDILKHANEFIDQVKLDGTIARLAKKWSLAPCAPSICH
jgi:cystine transport system substrate-binding protein